MSKFTSSERNFEAVDIGYQSDHRPRIVVLLSHLRLTQVPSRLARTMHEVLPEFGGEADVRVIDRAFDHALELGHELERTRSADILVCAGATGAFLRKHLQLPVVLMRAHGVGVAPALAQASRVSPRVGVLTYREINHELDQLRDVFKFDLLQGAYTDLEGAREQVRRLARAGCGVVVGSPMVAEIAEEEGLSGALALSGELFRQALEDALALWRGAMKEQAKRHRLDAILRELHDGVLVLDKDGRVELLNLAMARLLEVDSDRAIGRRIDDLLPGCGMDEAVASGREISNKVMALKGRSLLANLTTFQQGGRGAGAVLTARETADVQRADGHVRAQSRPGRFAARHVLRDIVAESAEMRTMVKMSERYAQTDSTVLITGESGTGKELLAQGIHNASRRRDRPFVAINCGALAESLLESELFGYEEGAFTGSRRGGKPGLFEAAHTGTVFLDEIGDMPPLLQTRLLRVLQEREVLRLGGVEPTPIDVRVIAATHRDLKAEIVAGTFRDDLYYRIQVLRIRVPPLRERPSDIRAIAFRLAERLARRMNASSSVDGIVAALMPRLQAYHWPGNVRELQSILERALLLGPFPDDQSVDDVPLIRELLPELFESPPPAERPADLRHVGKAIEIAHVRKIVEECGGNLGEAAKRLGVSRSTVWRRLRSGR